MTIATRQNVDLYDTDLLEKSWQDALRDELAKPYIQDLMSFVKTEKERGKTIFPQDRDVFRALDLTPLPKVRAVILGQDPYHGENQAHGLCFSVKPGIKPPPSLKNIYKELHADLGHTPVQHGFLESWARQGVLLLNSVLTVEKGKAASHQGKGWEQFTDAVIQHVNALDHPVVFLLWGAYAQKKAALVDTSKHLALKTTHPSPFSAHKGFLGSKHFSKANSFLDKNRLGRIDWVLPQDPAS